MEVLGCGCESVKHVTKRGVTPDGCGVPSRLLNVIEQILILIGVGVGISPTYHCQNCRGKGGPFLGAKKGVLVVRVVA